jgi:hypothetical protein
MFSSQPPAGAMQTNFRITITMRPGNVIETHEHAGDFKER